MARKFCISPHSMTVTCPDGQVLELEKVFVDEDDDGEMYVYQAEWNNIVVKFYPDDHDNSWLQGGEDVDFRPLNQNDGYLLSILCECGAEMGEGDCRKCEQDRDFENLPIDEFHAKWMH